MRHVRAAHALTANAAASLAAWLVWTLRRAKIAIVRENVFEAWHAVRCVFVVSDRTEQGARTYEERITLWRAGSMTEAIARAEAEALQYADDVEMTYAGLAQCYHLADEPGDGAEVFSLMRDSTLDPQAYLDNFFDTGAERQGDVG